MIPWILIAMTLTIFAVDILFKQVIVDLLKDGEERTLRGLPDFLKKSSNENTGDGKILIRKVYNKGAMLGLCKNRPQFVKKVSVLTGGAMLLYDAWLLSRKRRPVKKLGMMILTGGALSNLFDRLLRGKVVDYIGFRSHNKMLNSITYNLGDFAIFAGAILTVIADFLHPKKKKEKSKKQKIKAQKTPSPDSE